MVSGKYSTRDLLKTIKLFPKRDTVSHIVGVAKITPLKNLYKTPRGSSWSSLLLAKVWLQLIHHKRFLCKFVEVFLRTTVISEKFDPYKT